MQFLLVNASLARDGNNDILDPARPSDANGDIINELDTDSTLSIFDSDPTNERTESRNLPPYDVQYLPGLEGVESVVFTITNQETQDFLIVVDNFAPYAVSRAVDGFFKEEPILRTDAVLTIEAQAYTQDIYLDLPPGQPITPADIAPFAEFKKGESFAIRDIEVTSAEGSRTDFNSGPSTANVESEVEVELSAQDGSASAAVALAGAAGARGAESLAGVVTSGSLALGALDERGIPVDPTVGPAQGGITRLPVLGSSGPADPPATPNGVVIASAEGEAEVEVEAEAEAAVGTRAAAAGAGTVVTLSGTGVDAYLAPDGGAVPVAADSALVVDVASSTTTSLSPVFLGGKGASAGSGAETAPSPSSEKDAGPSSDGLAPTSSSSLKALALQADTEAEVESEVEAEAATAAGEGVAAAAATGGAGSVATGDFAAGAARVAVATSAATNTVRERLPKLFAVEQVTLERERSVTCGQAPASVSGAKASEGALGEPEAVGTSDDAPQSIVVARPVPRGDEFRGTGRGLSEAEAEAEAEAEVEAEVGNGSAAVACVAAATGAAVGLAATGRAACAVSASTTALDRATGTVTRGTEQLANDRVAVQAGRETAAPSARFALPADATADTEAEASAEPGQIPSVFFTTPPAATGDVRAEVTDYLVGAVPYRPTPPLTPSSGVTDRLRDRGVTNPRPPNGARLLVADAEGNLEVEVEAEVEVEVEAEVGYTSAAAGAAVAAIQAENGLVVTPAEAAAATSTSTSVLGSGETLRQRGDRPNADRPGPALPGARGDVPDPDADLSGAVFEREREAEAEAEVGYFAGAASAGAASTGTPDRFNPAADALAVSTPYAAAAAAAAGERTRVVVYVPPEDDLTGTAYAYAYAYDSDGGPVAIALALAGVPLSKTIEDQDGNTYEVGLDNEVEFEAEGLGELECFLELRYDRTDVPIDRYLLQTDTVSSGSDGEPDGPDSTFEDEAEAEVEAEAEAGYGVAAAAAGAGAAGTYSVVRTATQTATADPEVAGEGPFAYETIYENRPPKGTTV